MLPLAAALFAATPLLATPPAMSIRGGTPFERRAVKAAITEVPACFRDAGDAPVTVQIVQSDENNAYFDFEKQVVEVNEAAIPGTSLYEQALHDDAAYACTSVRRMRRFGNLDATLLHEFVHHFHFDGEHTVAGSKQIESNERLVDEFLGLKFDHARALARRNWRVRQLYRLLNNLDAIERWTPDEQDRFCAWQDELDRRISQYGFPARYPGDGPYTLDDGTGGEYFAEAVETWAYYPDVFCRAYSPAERDWLVQHLGDCLRATGRTPSCIKTPSTAEVSRRVPAGHPR